MKVYLAGGINGLPDADCKDWREQVKAGAPHHEYLDPMRRDYRGKEDQSVNEIVRGDYADIDASDVVIVMADRPSWGTAMECHYAFGEANKHVVVVCGAERVSPWLRYHSDKLVSSVADLLTYLRELR